MCNIYPSGALSCPACYLGWANDMVSLCPGTQGPPVHYYSYLTTTVLTLRDRVVYQCVCVYVSTHEQSAIFVYQAGTEHVTAAVDT